MLRDMWGLAMGQSLEERRDRGGRRAGPETAGMKRTEEKLWGGVMV